MHDNDCGALFKHINCALQKHVNNELRDNDLTYAQVHLLFILREEPKGCSLKELERRIKVAQSTTAGLVKRSAEKGFVECFDGEGDRRSKYVRITEKGLQVCLDTEEHIRRSERRLTANLTEAETETLICLLEKVYSAVSHPE